MKKQILIHLHIIIRSPVLNSVSSFQNYSIHYTVYCTVLSIIMSNTFNTCPDTMRVSDKTKIKLELNENQYCASHLLQTSTLENNHQKSNITDFFTEAA